MKIDIHVQADFVNLTIIENSLKAFALDLINLKTIFLLKLCRLYMILF